MNTIKKQISFMLVIALVAQMFFIFSNDSKVYAAENQGVYISSINENKILVKENDSKHIISVKENEIEKLVTIKNLETKQTDYIRYDKTNNTVYSSLVNKSFDIEKNKTLNPNANIYTSRASTTYRTKYISFKDIKEFIGETVTVSRVIGAISFFIPGGKIVSGAMGSISTVIDYFGGKIPNDSKHGFVVKLKVTKYYRKRGKHRRVYNTVTNIISISRY